MTNNKQLKSKTGHSPDNIFVFCTALLVIFGFVILASASSDLGKIKFNDTYYYLKHQLLYGLTLGFFGFLFGFFVHYGFWRKMAVPLLLISIIGLILVFTPLGLARGTATRWLNFGPFSIQPAEFLKIAFIIYLAAWLSVKAKARQKEFLTGFLPFLAVLGIITFLIMLQPSMSTVAALMTAAFIVYFISGAKLRYIIGAVLIGAAIFSLFIYLTGYNINRVITYLKPDADAQNAGFHVNQTKIAIGSGGFFGVGFGKSTAKFNSLPEPIGDSIFAVIAEELGFIGVLTLIIVFTALLIRGFIIALKSRDEFAKLTAVGFSSLIAFQTFVHIAAVSGLTPLTGIPLPFISYGSTSLIVFLTMAGIIGNISKYT